MADWSSSRRSPLKGVAMLDYFKGLTARITGRKRKVPCPECKGVDHFKLAGESRFDRPQTREVIKACSLCKGQGFLTSESTEWIKLGRKIKEYRTRKGMPQTEFAHRYGGLKTAELDAIERGYRNPAAFIAFLNQRGIDIDATDGSSNTKRPASSKQAASRN